MADAQVSSRRTRINGVQDIILVVGIVVIAGELYRVALYEVDCQDGLRACLHSARDRVPWSNWALWKVPSGCASEAIFDLQRRKSWLRCLKGLVEEDYNRW